MARLPRLKSSVTAETAKLLDDMLAHPEKYPKNPKVTKALAAMEATVKARRRKKKGGTS
jgi:hypothetical protein